MSGSNTGNQPAYNTATTKEGFLSLCSYAELILLYRHFINKDIEKGSFSKVGLIAALKECDLSLEEFWDFLDEKIYFYKVVSEGMVVRRESDLYYILDPVSAKEIRYSYNDEHGWISA